MSLNNMQNLELDIALKCKDNNITIGAHSSGGRAYKHTRLIKIRPVKSRVTYAIALHEIGHILGRYQSSYRLEKEAYAWKWAMDNSIVWTEVMDKRMRKDLNSYLKWAKEKQGRETPPVIPPDNHLFWALI